MRPVPIRRSASTQRRSSRTGVPRFVAPRSTWLSASRPWWLTIRTSPSTVSSPSISRSSSLVLGRWSPVATRIVTALRGTPASLRHSRTGGMMTLLGTGRVMSETRMQALLYPHANSRKGAAPMGAARDSRTASSAQCIGGRGVSRRTAATLSAGSSTSSPFFPYRRCICRRSIVRVSRIPARGSRAGKAMVTHASRQRQRAA